MKLKLILLLISLFLVISCSPAVQNEIEIEKPDEVMEDKEVVKEKELKEEKEDEFVLPDFDEDNFEREAPVTNQYFRLTPGTKWSYEGETEEGTETVEVIVTDEWREVFGIPTLIVWDRVWLEGELIEDTKDWYAQDKEGNVWYMGEESVELIDGKVVSQAGSWEAGVDGAVPGIIFYANPVVGQKYYQEFYEGKAVDQGEVLALGETVTVPAGTYTGCVQTLDINPLDGDMEHKFNCPEPGMTVLEIGLEDGERVELISISEVELPIVFDELEVMEVSQEAVTEERAKEIALEAVPGRITDIGKERKLGQITWVVEIRPDRGPETDVIIDPETGEVLKIET